MDLPVIGPVLKKIFGSANDRMVARYLRLAKQVSELESSVRPLTDAEIKAKTGEFRSRLADGASISEPDAGDLCGRARSHGPSGGYQGDFRSGAWLRSIHTA